MGKQHNLELLSSLIDNYGAHLVCLGTGSNGVPNRAYHDDWQTVPATLEELERCRTVGLIPASVGLVCIDIDRDAQTVGPAITDGFPAVDRLTVFSSSRRNRQKAHCYLPVALVDMPEDLTRRNVYHEGRHVGELIFQRSQVAMYRDTPRKMLDYLQALKLEHESFAWERLESLTRKPGDDSDSGKRRHGRGGRNSNSNPGGLPGWSLEDLWRMSDCYPAPTCYRERLDLLFSLKSAGYDYDGSFEDDDLFELWEDICDRDDSYAEASNRGRRFWRKAGTPGERTLGSYVHACKNGGWQGGRTPSKSTASDRKPSKADKGQTHMDGVPVLTTQDGPAIAEGLAALAVEWRYNLLGRRFEIRSEHPRFNGLLDDWQDMGDNENKLIRGAIHETCLLERETRDGPLQVPFWISQDKWDVGLQSLYTESYYHPFLDWIDDLPPWDFSTEKALAATRRLIHDHFRVPEWQHPLADWASLYVGLAVLTRTRQPGYPIKQSPILVGPPNGGKSTLLARLLPNELQHCFQDHYDFAADQIERVHNTEGMVLVEAGEALNLNRKAAAQMKGVLSSTKDNVRMKFGRRNIDMPRQYALVVTANIDSLEIHDDDGLVARLAAVDLHPRLPEGIDNAVAVSEYLDSNRRFYWSAVVHLYEEGHRPEMRDRTLLELARKSTNRYRGTSDALAEYLTTEFQIEQRTMEIFTIRDVMGRLALVADYTMRASEGDLKSALRKLGFRQAIRKYKRGGRSGRWWGMPKALEEHNIVYT